VSDPGESFALLRGATFEWAHALSERLAAAEIECRVESTSEVRSRDGGWAVYVRPEDLERAREIDRDVLRQVMPDLPEDFDPSALDTSRCPACGEPVAEGAAECAGCGLALL
jgi:hypothetical protein